MPWHQNKDINREQNASKNYHNSKINICHQTVSVTAGKMKQDLQIAT